MNSFVYNLNENLDVNLSEVGGKAANLVRLANVDDINLPEGFCITTTSYTEIFQNNEVLDELLAELAQVKINEFERISKLSSDIREIIVNTHIQENIVDEIKCHYKRIGEEKAYAVRSSATAEDLPTASFAGQHDTYLNIIGLSSILEHISKCWASLFTDRAVTYRIRNGFDHKEVKLAVIIQEMISSEASGVMFTADPISSDRKIVSIDAVFGLGEMLVSGHADSDHYKVCDGRITEKKIASKSTGICVKANGGTKEFVIDENSKNKQILSDIQILKLERLGRAIESYFSYPQDIEWCIIDEQIYIVQSRPVTTLYPLPDVSDSQKRIYVSSGHLQMMTDPIKPLGMFFYKSVISNPPSKEIGGRLYLDMTNDLSTVVRRKITKYLLSEIGDTLLTNSIVKLTNNKKLMRNLPKGKDKVFDVNNSSSPIPIMINAYKAYKENNPDIVKEIIDEEEKDIEKMRVALSKLSGDEVFEYISKDHDNRRIKLMSPRNAGVMTAVMLSARSFDKKIKKWLGETNAADSIIMSIPNSVTTETGFSLLDVADVIRDYPEIIDYLNNPNETTFFEDIEKIKGGIPVCDAFREYLSKYGMRCSGDIDITVPRWIENPIELVPSIINNIKNFEPKASKFKYEQGKIQSESRLQELIDQVEKLPNGKKKAKKLRRMASLIRNYIGYREYPKFSYMKRYYFYKEAMLKEAAKLVQNGYIDELEDIYYLYFDELRAMVNGQKIDSNIILKRKKDYEMFLKLTPPRVMTSDGEIIIGEYETGSIPDNALPGLPVSAGVVEGRARIVKSLKDSFLSEGDILVTEFTDPSWTPAFVSIKGLITEVGGLSTHGAIIAREYGLPAVVSVRDATKLIKEGQLIRLNGTEGYIEILSEESNS
ncbi:MAG: phosphoenolpyruvate synthase [Clostridiales bacterium]|nr:phosphoenolpyruvate synthase [Clostridiales bacterium]